MTADTRDDGFFWSRYTDGNGRWALRNGARLQEGPPGSDLAALRSGLGQEPGSVPKMWRYYTRLTRSGLLTPALRAEHAALTLYGLHQQSQAHPMHRAGVGLGTATLELLRHENKVTTAGGSQETPATGEQPLDRSRISPVDRKLASAATATSHTELVGHLRGLVTRLRGIGQPLDYSQLYRDLLGWEIPPRAAVIRRHWGSQYFRRTTPGNSTNQADSTTNHLEENS